MVKFAREFGNPDAVMDLEIIALIAAVVASQRKVVLYYDNEGIWLYSGLLPWYRGVSGIRWCDLGKATFNPGIFAWATQAYTVTLTDRFARECEIRVRFMHRGQCARAHQRDACTDAPASSARLSGRERRAFLLFSRRPTASAP